MSSMEATLTCPDPLGWHPFVYRSNLLVSQPILSGLPWNARRRRSANRDNALPRSYATSRRSTLTATLLLPLSFRHRGYGQPSGGPLVAVFLRHMSI